MPRPHHRGPCRRLSVAGAPVRVALGALAELLLPEHCAACGADVAFAPWEETGPRATGLRPWDRPHLCRACCRRLFCQPRHGVLEGRAAGGDADPRLDLTVVAAAATSAALADLVGAWKYHGVRGLGWPLARALAGALAPLAAEATGPLVLVPVPLHPSRQRQRGFNQAAMLAELAGVITRVPVAGGALRRRRATSQQARLADASAREANLAGAFAAASAAGPVRVVLVDDLVTAGATVRAAAAALREAGWEVSGVAALGLAMSRDDGDGAHVDTPDDDL